MENRIHNLHENQKYKKNIFISFRLLLASSFSRFIFLFRNLIVAYRFPVIHESVIGDYKIHGINGKSLNNAMKLFRSINGNANYDIFMLLLYKLVGVKIGFVIVNQQNEVIGVELYYFNKRDLKEGTVHQAFRGIHENYRGHGLGTGLTQSALEHFEKTRLQGVSSRVSLNNKASLISNLKLGFEIVEVYYEQRAESREQRAYLIKRFASRG